MKKILIIENETSICEFIEHLILTKNQFIVETAFDLDNGLNYLLESNFDILILDIMMEPLSGSDTTSTTNSGIDALQIFREKLYENKKELPIIIAITAVEEVLGVARAHPMIRKVIYKRVKDWEQCLIAELLSI